MRATALVTGLLVLAAGAAGAGIAFVSRLQNNLCLTLSNEYEPDPFSGLGMLLAKPCAAGNRERYQVFEPSGSLQGARLEVQNYGNMCLQPTSGSGMDDITTFRCSSNPSQLWAYAGSSGSLVWNVQINGLPACLRFFPGDSNGPYPNKHPDMVRTSTDCAVQAARWDLVNVPDCNPGEALEFRAPTKTFECVACPANTRSVRDGAILSCEPCVEGTFSDVPSDSCTNCAVDGGTCAACPLGTRLHYASGCLECSAGTYSDALGSEECHECAPGSVQPNPRSSSCLPCAPGFVQQISRQTECEPCPAGETNNVARTICRPCVEGTYLDEPSRLCINCAESKGTCEACPVGKALEFDLGCVECAAGTFNDVPGGEVCPKCAPGSAQANPGSESCSTCLPGYVQPEEGKTDCVKCAAGESNNANRTICEACAPGTFAKTSGSACNKCPAGQYQDGTGATSCKPCGKGEYSAEGQDKCTLCPAGTFNDKGGSGECSKCPTNTVQKEEGQTDCTECKRGEAPNEAATECAPCPPGTHAKDGVCVECAAGSFSQGGASSCDLCDEGFSSEAGSTECKPCEEGVTKTRGAVCEPCPEGQKPNPERRRCALCDAGDADPACKPKGSTASSPTLPASLAVAAAGLTLAYH